MHPPHIPSLDVTVLFTYLLYVSIVK